MVTKSRHNASAFMELLPMVKLVKEVTEAQQAARILAAKMDSERENLTVLENKVIKASASEGKSAKEYAAYLDAAFPAAATPLAWCDAKKSHKSPFGQFVWESRTRIVEAVRESGHSNPDIVWARIKKASAFYNAPEKAEKAEVSLTEKIEKNAREGLRLAIESGDKDLIAMERSRCEYLGLEISES
jgi:hypothetical protein